VHLKLVPLPEGDSPCRGKEDTGGSVKGNEERKNTRNKEEARPRTSGTLANDPGVERGDCQRDIREKKVEDLVFVRLS